LSTSSTSVHHFFVHSVHFSLLPSQSKISSTLRCGFFRLFH
jgi:hypothetical protein